LGLNPPYGLILNQNSTDQIAERIASRVGRLVD